MTVLSETIRDHNFYDAIFSAAIRLLGQPAALSVGVELASKEEIRAVNRAHRGIDCATDVLSFPTLPLTAGEIVDPSAHTADTDPETGEVYLGDVLLCDEVAREQAAEYGHSEERERGYLFCHALLHLFGYDHMTDADKTEMREREERIMRALDLTRGD